MIIEKILTTSKREAPLKDFRVKIVIPEIKRSPKLKEYYDLMQKLDDMGLLIRIFLPLLNETDRKLLENPTKRDNVTEEILESFNILVQVATKEKGEKIPLVLKGKFISFCIVLISSAIILEIKKDHYVKWIQEKLHEACDVYILAAGIAVNTTKEIVEKHFKKLKMKESSYMLPSGKEGVCILLRKK